jgi:hypothetical protein
VNLEDLQHRIINAIFLLEDGHSLKVGDLLFDSTGKNHISVTGWTRNQTLSSLTKETAMSELNEIKTLFNKMAEVSNELNNFLKERNIEYCLDFDYGTGAIGICKEINGEIIWETDLR